MRERKRERIREGIRERKREIMTERKREENRKTERWRVGDKIENGEGKDSKGE